MYQLIGDLIRREISSKEEVASLEVMDFSEESKHKMMTFFNQFEQEEEFVAKYDQKQEFEIYSWPGGVGLDGTVLAISTKDGFEIYTSLCYEDFFEELFKVIRKENPLKIIILR